MQKNHSSEKLYSLPDEAYNYAKNYGPCDDTRSIASKDLIWGYMYAKVIDKCPRTIFVN